MRVAGNGRGGGRGTLPDAFDVVDDGNGGVGALEEVALRTNPRDEFCKG